VKITVFFNHKPGILNNYIIIIFIARMVILASHVTDNCIVFENFTASVFDLMVANIRLLASVTRRQ
jgi:hypothetical protein